MDARTGELMDYLLESMNHTDASGFELIEIFDIRSRLATREPLLTDEDKSHLEAIDRNPLKMDDLLLERISEVADLAQMRRRAHILPSHWWWYWDQIKLAQREAVVWYKNSLTEV